MRRAQSESNRNAAIGSAFSALGTAAGGVDKMVGLYGEQKKAAAAAAAGGKASQAKSKYDIVIGEKDKNTGLPANNSYDYFNSSTNNFKPS
jgi:hypothetical protein